jgi:hypothetical protein
MWIYFNLGFDEVFNRTGHWIQLQSTNVRALLLLVLVSRAQMYFLFMVSGITGYQRKGSLFKMKIPIQNI